jgi:hypothetical protein
MVTITRREIRQRRFFGKLNKFLFYLYNFVMAAWLAALLHVASQTTRDSLSQSRRDEEGRRRQGRDPGRAGKATEKG